jgi:hypothetical protein
MSGIIGLARIIVPDRGVLTMSTTIGTGSIIDQLNAVAITLRELENLPAVAWRWGRVVGALEDVVRRLSVVRRQGGATASVAGPVAWLEATVRDHPAMQEPGAEPLREELLRLADRIRYLTS